MINLSERFVSQAMGRTSFRASNRFKSECRPRNSVGHHAGQARGPAQRVRQSFAAGNPRCTAGEFKSAFRELKAEFDVRQSSPLPPATSFLRVHKPEKFGDDLSASANTVLEVNATKSSLSGLEASSPESDRGLAPISLDAKHLGSVEFASACTAFLSRKFTSKTPSSGPIFALPMTAFYEIGPPARRQTPPGSLDLRRSLPANGVTIGNIARNEASMPAFRVSDHGFLRKHIGWRSAGRPHQLPTPFPPPIVPPRSPCL